MSHAIPTLRAFLAACLFLAGGPGFAATPAPPTDEESLALVQAAYARSVLPGEQAEFYRELFGAVLQRIKRSHVSQVDLMALASTARNVLDPLPPGAGEPAEVFRKVVRETLRTLDPHSRYVQARVPGGEGTDPGNSFGGVGLEVEAADGAVRVVAPMPGSPAARAGLVPGDLIVKVDEQSLAGVPLAEAIALMRGQPGTPVAITVQRAGLPREFNVSITRDTIRRQALRWSMEGDVLVLRLGTFTGTASASIEQAIRDATAARPPQAVVLDMRGNPGGLLREAVRVADTFLGKGDIVSLRGNRSTRPPTPRAADPEELLAGVPMVVLIDARSASASELVADALQHNGRAIVMGQRSYGKGSVQTSFPLGENRGSLMLTTAIYHGPSGETVDRIGVVPDVEMTSPPRAAGGTPPSRASRARVEPDRCTPVVDRDAALSCALAYLRSGSVEAFVAALPRAGS